MKKLKTTFLLLCGLWLAVNITTAQTAAVYSAIIDPSVNGEELANQNYTPIEGRAVTYDLGTWAAVKVSVDTEQSNSEHYIHLAYALIDTVELWLPDQNGTIQLDLRTGQSFRFDTRAYYSSDFVFPMKEGISEYYFRVYSSKPVVLPFHVKSSEKLVRSLMNKDVGFGIYFGIMMVMFLYNLVLAFITREKSYLYYIVFLIT
ncbi:MAG: hypothetical protein HRT74_12465, partial [Flavobacteriales bacterium]|nr:hypothetical protein [Flavobacteriales bacterium]